MVGDEKGGEGCRQLWSLDPPIEEGREGEKARRELGSVFINVISALEVFLNDMRYINLCFTYLLT